MVLFLLSHCFEAVVPSQTDCFVCLLFLNVATVFVVLCFFMLEVVLLSMVLVLSPIGVEEMMVRLLVAYLLLVLVTMLKDSLKLHA